MSRKGFIGASDVGAILGINPFCSPLRLWAEKRGLIQEGEEQEYHEWGKRLERVVSKKFSDDHQVKLIARKKRFVHPSMKYFSCELDNIIVGTSENVEIKTVNAYNWKAWSEPDEMPAYIIAQVMAQMGLSKRKKTWVACLCGGQKYIEKQVAFDAEFYSEIEKRVADFWRMVQDNIPPMASALDADVLYELHPKNTEQIVEDEDMNDSIAYFQEIKMQIGDMMREHDKLKNEIKQKIGDNLGIKTSKYSVTWKEHHKKEYVVKASSSRVLRVRVNKGAK